MAGFHVSTPGLFFFSFFFFFPIVFISLFISFDFPTKDARQLQASANQRHSCVIVDSFCPWAARLHSTGSAPSLFAVGLYRPLLGGSTRYDTVT